MKYTRDNYEMYVIDYLEGNLPTADHEAFRLFLIQHPDIAATVEGLEEVILPAMDIEPFPDIQLLKKSECPLTPEQLDHLFVARLEGQIKMEDEAVLAGLEQKFPEVAARGKAFARSKVLAPSVVFEDKAALLFPEKIDMAAPENRLIALLEGDLSQSETDVLQRKLASDAALRAERDRFNRTRLIAPSIVFEGKNALYQKQTRVVYFSRWVYAATAAAAALLAWVIFRPDSPGFSGQMASLHQPLQEVHQPGLTEPTQTDAADSITAPVTTQQPKRTSAPRQIEVQEEYAETQPASRKPIVKSLDKLKHTSLDYERGSAEAVAVYRAIPSDQPVGSLNTALAHQQDWMTLGAFLEDKAKETLWGANDYPEEGFTLALAQRTINRSRVAKAVPGVEVESEKSEAQKTFKFRIGKIEFERKHAS
ncbi:MAG: hypothetical protein JNM00_14130 [Flavobacteriales bacterium]|nr:hypothetical protein [Flavobacteriales bacterium]